MMVCEANKRAEQINERYTIHPTLYVDDESTIYTGGKKIVPFGFQLFAGDQQVEVSIFKKLTL